jgi:hypothetical protein
MIRNNSEKLLMILLTIQKKYSCSLFDAALQFCDEHQFDTEDFMSMIDTNIRERLRMDIINNHGVQWKIGKPGNTLFD